MSVKLIYPYLKTHKYKIVMGIFLLLVVDFFQLLIPFVLKKAIDVITYNVNDYQQIIKYGAFIIGSGIFITILRYWWRILLIGTSRHIEKGIRQELFYHILNLDNIFFDKTKTGDIMTHATSDITHIRMAFGIGVVAFTDAVLLGSATIMMMLYLNCKLTLLSLIPMPFIIFITRVLGRKMHDYHNDAQTCFSDLTESIRESFFGIRIIKVFNFEDVINKRVINLSENYYKKSLKRAFVTSVIRPLMILFLNASLFIITFYGGWLVIEGTITAGDLVAFIQYLSLLAWPMIALGWMTNLLQRGLASLKRINNIIETKPKVENKPNSLFIDDIREIKFENVDFSYEKNKEVLKNIDLEIKKGSFVGITGPPGSGKSSLISLILRRYDPNFGQITVNGNSLKNINLSSLRSHIAYMPQESFLFTGTLRENILLGQKEDKDFLEKVIFHAGLESTIANMPMGINTVVGERGLTLSGGQKQRMALARTLYLKKPVVILDDPVSQLDTDTAKDIISRLKSKSDLRTLIIVSHRISSIASADKIVIMKNHEIDDFGAHEYLMENNLFYKNLYEIQLFKDKDGTSE